MEVKGGVTEVKAETLRLQVQRQGAPGDPIAVILPPTARCWGEKIKILADAVGVTSVSAVLLREADGHEDEMDDKRRSWQFAAQTRSTIVIVAEHTTPVLSVTRHPATEQQIHGISGTTKQPLKSATNKVEWTPPPYWRPLTSESKEQLPEGEQNWRRILALFFEEPCVVPRIFQEIFIACWNKAYPDFVWDDKVKVPQDWKWGDSEPASDEQDDGTWVHKFALLLLHGSGAATPVKVDFTVTRKAQGGVLVAEGGIDDLSDVFRPNDWLQIDDHGTILTGKVKHVQGREIVTTIKNNGIPRKGVAVWRPAISPPRKLPRTGGKLVCGISDCKKKLKSGGVGALDATSLHELLNTPRSHGGFKEVLLSLPNGKTILDLIVQLKNIRNTLAAHLVGGSVPSKTFCKVPPLVIELARKCREAGILTEDTASFCVSSVEGIVSHVFCQSDLLDMMPGRTPAEFAFKSDCRMRKLTAEQASDYEQHIFRSREPRIVVEAPAGSGKTLLCKHLALGFLAGRVVIVEESPSSSPSRFLLLTHGPALTKDCVEYVMQSALQLGIRLDLVPVSNDGGAILRTLWTGTPVEIYILHIDILVQVVTGLSTPCDSLPRNWSSKLGFVFDEAVIDEAHIVFSHQAAADLSGQHLLKNVDDVTAVLNAVAPDSCRMVVFHDPDQSKDRQCGFNLKCKTMKLLLPIVRCTAAVRDFSIVYAQSLCSVDNVAEVQFVPLLDELNTGPDIDFIPVHLPPTWKYNLNMAQLKFQRQSGRKRIRSHSRRKAKSLGKLSDSTGAGVLAFVDAIRERSSIDAEVRSASGHYADRIGFVLRSIQQDYIDDPDGNTGWGDVAVVVPGKPTTLLHDLLSICRTSRHPVFAHVQRVVQDATADASDRTRLYFGPVEDIVGLERAIVVVTGFWHPLALLERPPEQVSSQGQSWIRRVDNRVYVAVTRCTHRAFVVEPEVDFFASHFTIRNALCGGVATLQGKPVGGSAEEVEIRGHNDSNGGTYGRIIPTRFTKSLAKEIPAHLLQEMWASKTLLSTLPLWMQRDRAVVLSALEAGAFDLQQLAHDLVDDREIVRRVITGRFSAFTAITSSQLWRDEPFVRDMHTWLGKHSTSVNSIASTVHMKPAAWQNNRLFVLLAEMMCLNAFKFATSDLREDRDFVLRLARTNRQTLQFAAAEMRNDREVVLNAVQTNGLALKYPSAELRNDRQVVLAAVQMDGRALKYASAQVCNDCEVVLAAVQMDGQALQYASARVRNDREVVLAAVQMDGRALKYASAEMRNDREVVLAAVQKTGWALEYASVKMRSDHQVVLAALMNKWLLRRASAEMRNDRQVVLIAVQRDASDLKYASAELRNDREVVLAAVQKSGDALFLAPPNMRNDREVVLAALGILELISCRPASSILIRSMHSQWVLRNTSVKLRKDRKVILTAVQHAGQILQFAAAELRKDRQVVLAAVHQDWIALRYASGELRNDREVVLAAVQKKGWALQYASYEIRNDREVVLAAVQEDWHSLQYASAEMCNDREIVLAAVQIDEEALQYASAGMRNDREVILTAAQTRGSALKYASAKLRNNREVVLAAVQNTSSALKHASAKLRNDREIVLAAVGKSDEMRNDLEVGAAKLAFFYASAELRNDREVALAAIQNTGRALEFASAEMRNDREVVLAAVQQTWGALHFASAEMRNDRTVVLAALQHTGNALKYASAEICNDREVVLTAVQKNWESLQYASVEMRNDREVVLAAVQTSGDALNYASDEMCNDHEVVLAAVQTSGSALQYASAEMRNAYEVVLAAVQETTWALKYASAEMRNDNRVFQAASGRNCHLREYSSLENVLETPSVLDCYYTVMAAY